MCHANGRHGYFFGLLGLCCISAHAGDSGPSLTGMAPNPLPVKVGTPSIMTVTIDTPFEVDTGVPISSSDPSVAYPGSPQAAVSSLTFAAGSTVAPFPVVANASGTVQLTMTLGDTVASSVVEAVPADYIGSPYLTIAALLPNPLNLVQGTPAAMTVTLNSPAPEDTTVFAAEGQ